jgi:hypothetical protein
MPTATPPPRHRTLRLWPNSKIDLLHKHALLGDFQKLLMTQVDSCVPMFASDDHVGAGKRLSDVKSRQSVT